MLTSSKVNVPLWKSKFLQNSGYYSCRKLIPISYFRETQMGASRKGAMPPLAPPLVERPVVPAGLRVLPGNAFSLFYTPLTTDESTHIITASKSPK